MPQCWMLVQKSMALDFVGKTANWVDREAIDEKMKE
jgi:hypothetical protein